MTSLRFDAEILVFYKRRAPFANGKTVQSIQIS